MKKEVVHVPSTTGAPRILTQRKDPLSLQFILELPNKTRNVISIRTITILATLLSLIWLWKLALVIVVGVVAVIFWLKVSGVRKETVTVIRDTCITYSTHSYLGRTTFKSVPLNKLLGVTIMEGISGCRVRLILTLIVRVGQNRSQSVPIFTHLQPNIKILTNIRRDILSFTESYCKANVADFGKDNIMLTEDTLKKLERTNDKLKQAFRKENEKKDS